jgi:tetratricopeptide (TPR) repeat protein
VSSHSLARRYRESLLGGRPSESPPPSERVRTGHSLWHRYWTSLLGFRLREQNPDQVTQPSHHLGGSAARDVSLISDPRLEATSEARPLLLPPPVSNFVGREGELRLLTSLLNPASGTTEVVVSVVTGLGGVGKTALALQAGHIARERGWFPGGMFFIDMRGNEDTEAETGRALPSMLRSLGVDPAQIPPRVDEQGHLFRSLLSHIGKPVLVIVDNVSSESQVLPLVPAGARHRLLMTSRNVPAHSGTRIVKLTALDRASGVALLDATVRDYRISHDPKAAADLVELSGGLPLSLRIVAGLLRSYPAHSVGQLAAQVAEWHARSEALVRSAESDEVAVAAVVDLAYHLFDERRARVFRLLALNPSSEVSMAAAEALTDLPGREVREILEEMAASALIEPSDAEPPSKSPDRWMMRDLVRRYASRLSETYADVDERERARDRILDFYFHSAYAADVRLWARRDEAAQGVFTNRAEALAWLDAEWTNLMAAVRTAAKTGRNDVARDLSFALVPYLSWRHLIDGWQDVATISRESARALGDRRVEGAAVDQLGLALQEEERFGEAIAAHQEAAHIFQETGDKYLHGVALDNLGRALYREQRFKMAAAAHRQAAEIFEKAGYKHRQGLALDNLGLALQEAGQFEDATEAFQRAEVAYRGHDDGSAGLEAHDGGGQ